MLRRRPLLRLIAALSPVLLVGVSPALAQTSPINIDVDSAQRVNLRGSVASVVVANPQIADVAVVEGNILFITGKGYGVTEVVALDSIGRTLFQNRIVVTGGQTGSVRLWRGARPTEMACATNCSPSVRSVGQ